LVPERILCSVFVLLLFVCCLESYFTHTRLWEDARHYTKARLLLDMGPLRALLGLKVLDACHMLLKGFFFSKASIIKRGICIGSDVCV
jgi:hypothetical protein